MIDRSDWDWDPYKVSMTYLIQLCSCQTGADLQIPVFERERERMLRKVKEST